MTHDPHKLPDIGDDYLVQSYWKSSGEADLYIAFHKVIGGRYVVKILRSIEEGDRDGYLRWVERQKALQHPRILAIKDAGLAREPAGKPFVATEYFIWKATLRDQIKAVGALPPRLAEDITKAILDGLRHAHSRNPQVLHRDLKPENVLLVATHWSLRDLKLIDFSMAATSAYRLSGTPPYQSPEQTLGIGEVTPASDIFSAGAIFYELLTGRPAFYAPDTSSMQDRIRSDEIDLRDDKIDSYQAQFLERCLAKIPAERFSSADEAFDFLRAKPPTMPSTGQLPKLVAGILIAMIGLVLLGLLAVAIGERTPSPEVRRSRPDRSVQERTTPKQPTPEQPRSNTARPGNRTERTGTKPPLPVRAATSDWLLPFAVETGGKVVAASNRAPDQVRTFAGDSLVLKSSGCRGTRETRNCLLAIFRDDGRLVSKPWVSNGHDIELGLESWTPEAAYTLILIHRAKLRELRDQYGLGRDARSEELAPYLPRLKNSLAHVTLWYAP